MKKKFLLFTLIPLLVGCDFVIVGGNTGGGTSTEQRKGTTTLNVYSFNDYHGAVTGDLPLETLGTFIKKKTADTNNIVLDVGDTWQGSIESNYNRGKCINDVFNYAHMTARVIGNHDFDWGQENLKVRTSEAYNNYTTPVLGANIYNYNFQTKTNGTVQQSSLGQEYLIHTTSNGLKVGIIGTIGSNQITSITTSMVEDIYFEDHLAVTKRLSDYLRVEKSCDIIIAACHSGISTMTSRNDTYPLTKVSPVSNKKYCDLVLLGHTHSTTHEVVDGVLYSESGSRGSMITGVSLKYDFDTNTITSYGSSDYVTYSGTDISSMVGTTDSTIKSIVQGYKSECSTVASQSVKAKVSGSWYSSEQIPNLTAKAAYTAAKAYLTNKGSQYANLLGYSYTNAARASLYVKSWTYGDIYSAVPFDNDIYIMEVSGTVMMDEVASYNNVYRAVNTAVKTSGTYYVAVLDYLALHTNANRVYDYFPGCTVIDIVKRADGTAYNYRDMLSDYLKSTDQSETIYASDYSSSVDCFNRSLLSTAL